MGLLAGYLISKIRRLLDDPPVEITISLFSGYAAYLPAEELGFSGVLAAVTTGVYLGWMAPRISSANVRMQSQAVWELVVFLFNAVLFILVGLQLPGILEDLDGHSVGQLLGYAAAIIAVVVGSRFAWLFTMPYLIRLLDRRESQVARRVGAGPRIVSSWAGMRGAVTLAAALALPLNDRRRGAFPGARPADLPRLLGGPLHRGRAGADAPGPDPPARRRRRRRRRGARGGAGPDRVLGRGDRPPRRARVDVEWTNEDTVERVRRSYGFRRSRFAARTGEVDDRDYERRSMAYQRLLQEVIQAQREVLIKMRNEGEISSDVMRRIERELDLEETRLDI